MPCQGLKDDSYKEFVRVLLLVGFVALNEHHIIFMPCWIHMWFFFINLFPLQEKHSY